MSSQLYRVSHVRLPSISSLLNSHPSPSSLTYHPSPSAFSLRIDFKLAERFARVVLRCLSPTPLDSLAHFCCSPVSSFPFSLVYSSPWVHTQEPQLSPST